MFIILLPDFQTQGMMQRKGRKIGKISTRLMQSLSHYSFKTRLINKAKEYGTNIIIVTEEYTSKTCSSCGYLHKNLGKSKVYNCSNCKIVLDRDLNGAINILLKYLTESLKSS